MNLAKYLRFLGFEIIFTTQFLTLNQIFYEKSTNSIVSADICHSSGC